MLTHVPALHPTVFLIWFPFYNMKTRSKIETGKELFIPKDFSPHFDIKIVDRMIDTQDAMNTNFLQSWGFIIINRAVLIMKAKVMQIGIKVGKFKFEISYQVNN